MFYFELGSEASAARTVGQDINDQDQPRAIPIQNVLCVEKEANETGKEQILAP